MGRVRKTFMQQSAFAEGVMHRASRVRRRALLKFCAVTAPRLARPSGAARLPADGLQKARYLPVVWLPFQECIGRVVCLTRASAPTLEDLLFDWLSLDFRHTPQAVCALREGPRCSAALKSFELLYADADGCIGEDELLEALGRRQRGGRGY